MPELPDKHDIPAIAFLVGTVLLYVAVAFILGILLLSGCSSPTGPSGRPPTILITDSYTCPLTSMSFRECDRARSEWNPIDSPPANVFPVVVVTVQYPPSPLYMSYSLLLPFLSPNGKPTTVLVWYVQHSDVAPPVDGQIAVSDTIIFYPLAEERPDLIAEIGVATGPDRRYSDLVADTAFFWEGSEGTQHDGNH